MAKKNKQPTAKGKSIEQMKEEFDWVILDNGEIRFLKNGFNIGNKNRNSAPIPNGIKSIGHDFEYLKKKNVIFVVNMKKHFVNIYV